jgi:hypothetical protein
VRVKSVRELFKSRNVEKREGRIGRAGDDEETKRGDDDVEGCFAGAIACNG